METALIIIITIITFMALILNIAYLKKKKMGFKIMCISAVIISACGIGIYGYGYSHVPSTEGSPLLIVIKTALSTMGMFLAKNDFDKIQDAPLMQHNGMIIFFFVVHLLTSYATTSVILTTIGDKILNRVSLWLGKFRKNVDIIYGIDDESIKFGKELNKKNKTTVIFIDENISMEHAAEIDASGCLKYTVKDAVNAEISFLKKAGIDKAKKKTYVYAMSKNEALNFSFAVKFKNSLEKLEVSPLNTKLTLIANMEISYGKGIQASKSEYGFGSVMILDRAYLAARTLVNKYPPYQYVEFDHETAKAKDKETFHAVVIGFGKIGQAVLKNLVINGQFENCDFRVNVFDPNHEDVSGYIFQNSEAMMKNYDIRFAAENAHNKEFYNYVHENANDIDYIVVCTGNEDYNAEITGELQSTIQRYNGHAEIFQCTYKQIIYQNLNLDTAEVEITDVYTEKNMYIATADRKATALNHIYCMGGKSEEEYGKTAEEDWARAGYLDKMSCRASADFAPAFLYMTGKTEEEVLNTDVWSYEGLSEEQILNLSKTEHLRWCAFHYSMGFTKMTKEVFEERCEAYKKNTAIKINKDEDKYMHICLVDWDELDELTEKYRSITGNTTKDYKKDDTNNVMMLREVLRASK